jgi:ABC-type polysaccharide/polyol phosphate export permease
MLSPWARKSLYWLNPLSSFVLSFQHALVGGDIPYFLNTTPLIGFTYGLLFFAFGLLCFRRLQKIIVEK